MWPWLMIAFGVLLIGGGLVARHRMMRDYRAELAKEEQAENDKPWLPAPSRPAAQAASKPVATSAPQPAPKGAPQAQAQAQAKDEPPAQTSTSAPDAGRAADTRLPAQPSAFIPFADRPATHQLAPPPMLRTRSSDVPLLDWLRYYSSGNAWSGVIQSLSDRLSGDPLMKPYIGSMERTTLQHHVMSTVMALLSEGLTVGMVRRLADAQLSFVGRGGPPVTDEVWDKLTATFANALREHTVPESAVQALDVTLAPLRSVIVSSDSRPSS